MSDARAGSERRLGSGPAWAVVASLATALAVVLVLLGVVLDVGERMSDAKHVADGLDKLSASVAQARSDDARAENDWRAGEDHKLADLSDKMDALRHEFDVSSARLAYDRAQRR